MTTAAKREKLHHFIDTADDKQVKSIYSIFEDQIAPKYDHWEDEEFLNEIDQRIQDYESGKDKGLSWDEVKTKARNELKAKRV
jgi:putative addiction module component (TIGR02574 family)